MINDERRSHICVLIPVYKLYHAVLSDLNLSLELDGSLRKYIKLLYDVPENSDPHKHQNLQWALFEAHFECGKVLGDQGEIIGKINRLKIAIKHAEYVDRYNIDLPQCYHHLANALLKTGQATASARWINKSINYYLSIKRFMQNNNEKWSIENHHDLSLSYCALSSALAEQVMFDEAEKAICKAICLLNGLGRYTQQGRQEWPAHFQISLCDAYHSLSGILIDQGKFSKAIIQLHKAIEYMTNIPAGFDKSADYYNLQYRKANLHRNLGKALQEQNRFFEATKQTETAINLLEENPEGQLLLSQLLCDTGDLYFKQQQFDIAISKYILAAEQRPNSTTIKFGTSQNLFALEFSIYNSLGHAQVAHGIITNHSKTIKDGKEQLLKSYNLIRKYIFFLQSKNELEQVHHFKNYLAMTLLALAKVSNYNADYQSAINYLVQTEEGDKGALIFFSELEENGDFTHQNYREGSFSLAIKAFYHTCPDSLPELIIEHLSPDSTGSAPHSWGMLDVAKATLELFLSDLRHISQAEEKIIKKVKATLSMINELLVIYHSGSAESTRTLADALFKKKKSNEAEIVLRDFSEDQPSSRQGAINLYQFLCRKNKGKDINDENDERLTPLSNTGWVLVANWHYFNEQTKD